MTVSQWADEFRELSRESAAEPGKWSTARAEYQRGVLTRCRTRRATVVVPKASQVG